MGLSEDTRSQETALNSVGEWSGKIRNEEFLVEWRGVTRGHSEMRQNWIVKIFPRYYINTVRPKDLARNCTMWVFQYFMFSTMSVQSGLAFFVWNSVLPLTSDMLEDPGWVKNKTKNLYKNLCILLEQK